MRNIKAERAVLAWALLSSGSLRAQNAGLFHLDQCLLRGTDVTGAIRNQPHITATCRLAWITATPETPSGGRRP